MQSSSKMTFSEICESEFQGIFKQFNLFINLKSRTDFIKERKHALRLIYISFESLKEWSAMKDL